MTQAESSEKRSIRLQSLSGGNSSGREPGSPVESLEDKRKEAFFKVQAAKAAQLQRQQEIRVGEEWSEHLKLPANRTPEAMMNFWEEVKIRLLKCFGSLHMAVGGEHSVSFIQFCEILRVIHFPLHQSTCRHIFGQVCGGHREMPVDAFKALLMERTIHSMRFVLEGWNGKQARVRSHIRTFIRRLAEVDERQEEQAVDRFQRKLTASFIRNFWQLLLRKSSSREDVVITQTSLVQALLDPEANCIFQDHEMIYMLRIFEHMMKFRNSLCQTRGENGQSGQNGQSGVPVPGLPMSGYITGLTLVSMIPTKSEKLELIFEAFDLDADHCLLYKQIFELCHCVSVLKVMVEESARGSPDEHFQAELSQQEGQRSYECIRWHLQRRGVPGDIVSFPELRAAWETQPSLQSLLPGWVQIRWAAQALPGEDFSAVFASTFEGKSRQSHTKSRSRRSIQTAPTTGPSREDEWCVSEASRLPSGPQGNAAIFKSVLTAKFSKSLRDLGNRRLVELTRDFEVRRRSISDAKDGKGATKGLKDVKEVSTKDAEAPRSKVAEISRAQSAPSLVGSRKGLGNKREGDVASLPPQRWGQEAGNRFRIYAVVLTLLSLGLAHGFGNASQGAVHLGAAPESRNVARHRPCKPRPVCSHLVDGRIDLNALDRAQGWALARSSADPSPVLIFLKAPTFVSQIVVHLIHQGHPGAGRLLMVSLWQKASGREDLGPPTKRWKWDPERAIASGSFRVVVPVQQVAFAVAVAWEGPRDNGHGPDRSDRSTESASNASNASNISDIWISEVLVLQKTLSISQVSSLVSHDVSSLVSHDVSQVSHRATGGTAGTADAASETAGATTARALGVTLQSVNSVTHSVNTVSLDGPPRLRASTVSTVSTVSLSELSETVEQLEHELPKNEFTTSVQMHVQNEQNEQNEIERIPPIYMFSRTVKPSKEIAMDKETEKVENVEKVFGVSGVATAHKSQIPSAFGATSSSGASTPNASEFEKPGGRPEDPHFLSPWPGRRSELGMPLKTCLGALLAAVLLVLKFNKFAIFQCCKGIRANDLEYNYDRLPISREDAETWWERPEHGRESQESETREIRETCETCETRETREAREAREVCREVCRTGTAGTAGTAVVRDEQRNDGNDARANSRRPSATSATSCQAAASASSAASSASGSSQAQQRSLSPTLSVSDRTISEPEREPHDEPHSEPSISDPLSTLPSTTVSEAEDETDSNHSKFLLERSERCDTRPSDSEHMMLLYASPLCFRDGRGMIPLPQIPVEKEWETVLGAYNEAAHILARTSSSSPGVSISAQTLTAGSLQRASTTWHPGVLHLSSHGAKNCLVLEDGGGTAHFFSCSMLRGMLELAGSSTRLVLLNCCSLSSMGYEFVAAGVPHVVCCSCDLKDSASTVFVRNFYGFLFQGFSVQRSFNEAVVALRSHSEGQLQAASQHFRLLPETQGHEEVLFLPKAMDYDSDSSEGRLRWRRRPRRAKTCPQVQPSLCWRALPSLPEDFLGRELDVWSVLQQLNQRRAVVVCGAVGEDFGIGKSAILDSVHRHFTLLGHSCVAVPLRSLSQVSWAGDWIEKANAAIRLAIRECRGARMAGASSRRRRLQGPLRTGFHPLSARFEWTSSGHRILLLLDECDHLVQQPQFQDALACILQRCSSYSVVLSTHQPMVPAGASKFKVVQHRLQGLVPRDAARLLLRRAQRPLRWGEIQRSEDPSSLVILNKENETEVLEAVSSQPRVAALRGNPRRLIELANDLDSLNTVLT